MNQGFRMSESLPRHVQTSLLILQARQAPPEIISEVKKYKRY
jgi:hypothetical protein